VKGYGKLPQRPWDSRNKEMNFSRLALGNELREISGGCPRRRHSDGEEDIDYLIKDPGRAAELYRLKLERDYFHRIEDKGGRLTVDAFRDGLVTEPDTLWMALKTEENLQSAAPSFVWSSLVLPNLKETHAKQFSELDPKGTLILACNLMAGHVNPSVRLQSKPLKRRGPKRKYDVDEDKELAKKWSSYRDTNPTKSVADFVKEARIEMSKDQVKRAIDRARHK